MNKAFSAMKKTLPALLIAGALHTPIALACTGDATLFIAKQNASFSQRGDAWTEGFTLSGDVQTLILRFASVYQATAIIINASDADTFLNGGAVNYYEGFDNTFGTNSINLAAGNYALAIRNNNNGANNYSVELDCDKTFPDATRVNSRSETETVSANGGKLWQPLDVSDDYRLWIDGVNYGLETYLIPEGELSAFRGSGTFEYYTDFSSESSGAYPGGYEINLPEGRYYLAFRNQNADAMPVTYTIELFERLGDGANGGVAIDGSSSYSIANNQLSAEISSLVNTRGSTTSPLRLLWLASTDGTLNSVYTIAEFDLDDIQNLGNGSLAPNGSFTSITLTTAYDAPPSGSYQIILAVVETSDPNTVLDSVTYDSVVNLGTSGGGITSSSSQAYSSVEAPTSSSSEAATSSVSSSEAESSVEASSTASSAAASSQATTNNSGGGGGGGAIHWLGLFLLGSLALTRRRSK